jgi:hypothetical protein
MKVISVIAKEVVPVKQILLTDIKNPKGEK